MAAAAPPGIFAPARRIALRRRMLALQAGHDAPRYLIDDMVDDARERLAFLRAGPRTALVIGDFTGAIAAALTADGVDVAGAEPARGFDDERPFAEAAHDLIVSLGTLDTVNDLPGALIHLRAALAPGGLLIASLVGAGSLPRLRAAMLAADGERPAARLHPMIDVRAGAQLLQRAGFADPVADGWSRDVRFGALTRLVGDLRAQGLSNTLADHAPPLNRAAVERAEAAFLGGENRVAERFEIVTLTGWRR